MPALSKTFWWGLGGRTLKPGACLHRGLTLGTEDGAARRVYKNGDRTVNPEMTK